MTSINQKVSKKFNTKKKRNLLAILLLLVIGLVGVTFSYFGNTTTFKNIFKVKPFSTQVYEVFESPESWLPGMTTQKEVYAKNTGENDVKVRISYKEKWLSNVGEELSGDFNGERVAIINLTNEEDWTYEDGYYYYNEVLKPGETTSTFIESVTFNPNYSSEEICTKDSEGNETCTEPEKYDTGTYTLTFVIDMYQADMPVEELNS